MSTFGTLVRQLRGLPGASNQASPAVTPYGSIQGHRMSGGSCNLPDLRPRSTTRGDRADRVPVPTVPSAAVRRRYDRDMHSSAASSACSETINSADVYRAVEGRLGRLSTSAVVALCPPSKYECYFLPILPAFSLHKGCMTVQGTYKH